MRLTSRRIVTRGAVKDNFTKRTPIYKFLRYLVVSSMSIWHMLRKNPFCRLLVVCGSWLSVGQLWCCTLRNFGAYKKLCRVIWVLLSKSASLRARSPIMLLSRTALAWLLATPPIGELARRLQVCRQFRLVCFTAKLQQMFFLCLFLNVFVESSSILTFVVHLTGKYLILYDNKSRLKIFTSSFTIR